MPATPMASLAMFTLRNGGHPTQAAAVVPRARRPIPAIPALRNPAAQPVLGPWRPARAIPASANPAAHLVPRPHGHPGAPRPSAPPQPIRSPGPTATPAPPPSGPPHLTAPRAQRPTPAPYPPRPRTHPLPKPTHPRRTPGGPFTHVAPAKKPPAARARQDAAMGIRMLSRRTAPAQAPPPVHAVGASTARIPTSPATSLCHVAVDLRRRVAAHWESRKPAPVRPRDTAAWRLWADLAREYLTLCLTPAAPPVPFDGHRRRSDQAP
ncbi:hypothetical protein SSP24_17900 [Streptomyces spinoverrucosus]|uniref:Uncharacterized protein n=1 Tax=Streptomyces spinoverrucosus TaxID=284043 RepID=A0A4Y3VCX6_9ACTN|nr:hypothetical protein SSP24_17900 [Streptomyces spinoverrucosus]GHB46405.1 hypothetical protein GCM10010397_15360 [Streptomyces spinoverrucosus]